jgi:dipeptidyl aminopeptidase/acylaminoacyl peptidase
MKKLIAITLLILIACSSRSQENRRPLTFDDILNWNRITEKKISNDGNVIVYKVEPWKGDPVLKIVNKEGKDLKTVKCGRNAEFTYDSKTVIFTINPAEEVIRQLKLKKTKEDDMPLNKLGIYNLQKGVFDTISNLKTYKVPKKWDGWIAYQTKTNIVKDTTLNENDKKPKTESHDNGFTLNIRNLSNGEVKKFPFVTDYVLAKEAKSIAFVSTGDDEDFKPGVYFYDLKTQHTTKILIAKGTYKQLTLNDSGTKIAFLADTVKRKTKELDLYYWNREDTVKKVVNNENVNLKEGWTLSENGEITFSKKTNRIFFGTAPIKPDKDTTILDEEIPQLDIWHWNEPILHSQQLKTKADDFKKSYLAVYHIDENKMVQLENESFSGIKSIENGDADLLLAWSNLPYAVQTMWEGDPEHNDFYLVNVFTGETQLIKKDCRSIPDFSPEGKYIFWYNPVDASWNTFNIKELKEYKITDPALLQCADELNDIPNLPGEYGTAGWLKNDDALLVYDRFDIWKVDPEKKIKPANVTLNGRENNIVYRFMDFENANRNLTGDPEEGIDPAKLLYIKGHNEITREEGYYKSSLTNKKTPIELMAGKFALNRPLKAKNADVFVFTRESFEEFPDLLISENDFKKNRKISDVNPQQKDFLWGTKELYSWISLDGQKLDGLLIKPANFDPNKKYPMIVNFYEKASQHIYDHQIPEAHRSTIDYHYYSSNGYVIFNPDIYYKEGYPGESAFNCVMPGITKLISDGFIDKDHIAAQGHSWGGYQIAYLATRTNLFAAIESGAPVVNMFSAYGGIRLWTGRNRSFQYEHTQSRIGKSIWESPLRYIENSPLFTADKIETPMLIMHNEDDGAVPFSQGIEFFIALRRMGKQAWLLNYNEADHWPTKIHDKYDFQIRLAQFFDYYLKDEPMPLWMQEGIPAINKEFEMGYEIKN